MSAPAAMVLEVAHMTYVIMRRATRLFARWLFPPATSAGRRP